MTLDGWWTHGLIQVCTYIPLLKDPERGYLKFSATWAVMCTKKDRQLLLNCQQLHRVVRNSGLASSNFQLKDSGKQIRLFENSPTCLEDWPEGCSEDFGEYNVLPVATVWLWIERASWICPTEEHWPTGYYQSVTPISKIRGFQHAHISVFFRNRENSGIVSHISSRSRD